ncbi:MAG: paraquat-inducible protein A, partial [Burkholderiaceae bacterium]
MNRARSAFARLRRARGGNGSLAHLANSAIDDGVDALAPRLPLATLREELLACAECDTLHRRPRSDGESLVEPGTAVAPSGRHFECRRCGHPLGLVRHATFDLPLSLALSGLVLLAIAHLNRIIAIDLQGQERSTTLWQAAWTLYDEGYWFLCGTVLFTTLLNPLIELGAVCYVLLPLRAGEAAPGAGLVLRAMQAVRPWVMVEVFMLGALVALTKLSSLATVVPGVGLWAFGALMLLIAATASAFDHAQA